MDKPEPLTGDKLRCPFCNINDAPLIDKEEHEEAYKEGYRYFCVCCDRYFAEPVVDVSDIELVVKHKIRLFETRLLVLLSNWNNKLTLGDRTQLIQEITKLDDKVCFESFGVVMDVKR